MTACEFETSGTNRWRMHHAGHGFVSARLTDGWLCCEVPASCAADPVALLTRNATLPRSLKFAPDRTGRVCLRAELPVMDDAEVEASLRFLAASYAQSAGAAPVAGPLASAMPEQWETMEADKLATLCNGAGWPASIRGTECRVPLAFDDRRPAVVRVEGGLCASVDVVSPNPEHPACMAAVALLLFRAGGSVRLTRPVLMEGTVPRFRFEAFVPGPVCAENIVPALSALSLALECCAREAEALGDEALAEEFLALGGGGPAVPAITTKTKTTKP
ncbi:MAG: hypothetical protein ABMA01_01835 [Chthoniobacteraceae bacterium]